MATERRKLARRNFSYYMRVMDEVTGKLVGHLSDISTNGFKLDSQKPIPLKMALKLRIDQTGEVSNKRYLSFSAQAIWCQVDQFDPNLYNVGFQILNMTPSDYDVFAKMFNAYGTQKNSRQDNNLDKP